MSTLRRGSIVQVTDADHHWFPALLVVDEVKDWGVQAYTVQVNNARDEPNGLAYIRLPAESYTHVGQADVVTRSADEAEVKP